MKALLDTGQGGQGANCVREQRGSWSRWGIRQCAWICHRAQAFDLAFDLFPELFRRDRGNYKYLKALERAAQLAGRPAELRLL